MGQIRCVGWAVSAIDGPVFADSENRFKLLGQPVVAERSWAQFHRQQRLNDFRSLDQKEVRKETPLAP